MGEIPLQNEMKFVQICRNLLRNIYIYFLCMSLSKVRNFFYISYFFKQKMNKISEEIFFNVYYFLNFMGYL